MAALTSGEINFADAHDSPSKVASTSGWRLRNPARTPRV